MQTAHLQPLHFGAITKTSDTSVFELFLEPTCPFSKKAFDKIIPLLSVLGDEVIVILRLQSQPWHLFSPIITRCILAACLSDGGKESAFNMLNKIYENLDDFVCVNHCSGENLTKTQQDIINRISCLAEINLTDVFISPLVTDQMKWQAKYARQNGIHSSPTFMLDGVVDSRFTSGQSVEEWVQALAIN